MSEKQVEKHLKSDVADIDWEHIAESEFVDYAEGRRSVAFVFKHKKIGFHGIKFDPAKGVLRPVSFSERDGYE